MYVYGRCNIRLQVGLVLKRITSLAKTGIFMGKARVEAASPWCLQSHLSMLTRIKSIVTRKVTLCDACLPGNSTVDLLQIKYAQDGFVCLLRGGNFRQ